jgi:fibronectin type 3 domain-containing protein
MEARRRNRGRVRARLATISIGVALALPLLPANVVAGGQFMPYQAFAVGSSPEAVAIGDVTGDGRNDVVMTTWYAFDPENDFRLWVFAQTETGALAAPVSYPTSATYTERPSSVSIGDMTGDGRADVVLGLAGLGVQVFPQEATGLLGSPTLTSTIDSLRIRLGQLDGDGRLDVAGIGWGSDTVTVLLSDGVGGLGTGVTYPARHGGYDDLEVADVTHDGLADLVVMSGQTYAVPNITVLAQLSAGGFGLSGEYRVGTNINTHGIGVGDANGDGRNDVVVSYGGNSPTAFIAVFSGTDLGTLAAPDSHTSYDIPEPVEIADLDLDGRADVVTLHGGWNKAGVYRQRGDGTLATEDLYQIPYASTYSPHGLAVGDINGDDFPEIVLADYNHGLVVLRNTRLTPPPATAPGAPTLYAATGSDGMVTLGWIPPASDGGAAISGYNIYRGTTSGGEVLLATIGPDASYADTAVSNGSTYYYQVSAMNAVGEGPRSTERSAQPATVPAAPTLVSASAGNGSATLAWSAPASDGGSEIIGYIATASPGGATCSVPGLGCTIGGLANGTSYSFTVRARNAIGTGSPSNALTATPGQPPSAPVGISISPNQPEGILVSWTAPTSTGTGPITAYRIYRGSASGAATYLATVGNVLSFTDTAVSNGGLYYYQVAAVNVSREGPRSVEQSAQRGTAPSAPRSLTASSNGPGGVTLKWSAPSTNGGSPVTGYRIYRATASGGEAFLVSVAGTATSYADRSTT